LLAHKDETLEYKRQLAELGDKVEHQKRLNELAQQAVRFEEQQSAKQAAISAKPAVSLTVRRSGSLKRSVFGTCTVIIRLRWRRPHLH
ncbi:phage tail tape measure protein, partial [Escherichia coli]|nr:phage tail tape measure protein [Escherichia coli]